ncbi:hypothetical protein ADL27_23330, partial [Streptomyces sp. NRRL F-6602]
AGLRRLVYLGGLTPEGVPESRLSPHLRSRAEVGRILLDSGVPATVLRAAVVLGSGSASFEMLRYLTERLPLMITPSWVNTRMQPVAVRDVLAYLRVLANPEDSVSLRRILNTPKRGIGDRAEAMIDALSQRERVSFPQARRRVDEAYGMAARSANAVKRFNTLMEELRTVVESGA